MSCADVREDWRVESEEEDYLRVDLCCREVRTGVESVRETKSCVRVLKNCDLFEGEVLGYGKVDLLCGDVMTVVKFDGGRGDYV